MLTPENHALVQSCLDADPTAGWMHVGSHSLLEALLNACRLEERAKAEGEVEKWRGEFLEERSARMAANNREFTEQARAETAESNLAKAEARIADLKRERDAAEHRIARMVVEDTRIADLQAALSRATQAEELVREVVGVLEWMHRKGGLGYAIHDALEALIAKLKAAPLQGDGSSSVSGVESAAKRDLQPFCPQTPSSAGSETGWLVELNRLYSTGPKMGPDWTTDHMQAFRFTDRAEAERWRDTYYPQALVAEHMWITPMTSALPTPSLPADHTADDRPTEGSGVLSLAPDSEIPSASGSEQQ